MNLEVKLFSIISLLLKIKVYAQEIFSQGGCDAIHTGALQPNQLNLNYRCFTPTKSGKCLASFDSYHYVPQINQCVQSVFGGCDDGCQAYKTMKDCEENCVVASLPLTLDPPMPFSQNGCNLVKPKTIKSKYSDLPSMCFIKSNQGKCRLYFPSYHFDANLGTCVKSNFGGCDDGCLAFKSLEECEQSCWRASIGL